MMIFNELVRNAKNTDCFKYNDYWLRLVESIYFLLNLDLDGLIRYEICILSNPQQLITTIYSC